MAADAVATVQSLSGAGSTLSPGPVTTPEARALNRSVSAAAQTVNDSQYLGADRSVTFSVDQATRLPVVKVVDTSTNEVVEQWPPEYLLQLAAQVKDATQGNQTEDSG